MVTGILFDTAALLRYQSRDHRVPSALAQVPLWLSVISYWEVAIKGASGKLDVGGIEDWWSTSVGDLRARVLPFGADHVRIVARLPLLHRDPFDRALIGQAIAEDLTLLSPDRTIARYVSAGLKLLR